MKKRNILRAAGLCALLILGAFGFSACPAGTTEKNTTDDAIAQSLRGKLLVLQVFGDGGNSGVAVSHSFVELYNNSNSDIDMDNIYLWYANGRRANDPDFNADIDQDWSSIQLSGTLSAKCSYLILGAKNTGTPAASIRLTIQDGSGDQNVSSMVLGNRSFKVALIYSNTDLTDIQNPFDIDGAGTKAEGYIDMAGARNTAPDADPAKYDTINGYETAPARNSASVSIRRASLTDTDNNSVDFEQIRYVNDKDTSIPVWAETELLEFYGPKNMAYGAWDPMEKPDVVEPPPYTSDNTLLIFQAGASTNGAISHSFVELYNAGAVDVNLNGYSLQYANGGDPVDDDWAKIDLSGVLPKNCSYLILGTKGSPTGSQYEIPDNFGDINTQFSLSNDSFKVALIHNTSLLTVQNPFDSDGAGEPVTNYVDMLGAVNTGKIHGYETAVMPKISKQQTARRVSIIDTDNNEKDFTNIDYRTTGAALEFRGPKNVAYGAWDPVSGEKE
ncbi:MAG: lamin tail domain-containing protein [Treponema sp.]|nr:lamin tail domain-containing protein [Treponema sp.]